MSTVAACHHQRRVPARTKRPSTMGARRSVQWKEDIVETKFIEEYDSESEASTPPSSDQSMASLDSIPPAQMYSTRFSGLRRLTPSPHPLFPSERLQEPRTEGQRVRASIRVEIDHSGKMPSTRFSTPTADLDLAPLPPSSSASSILMRRSTDTLNESRRSSLTSSMMSPPPPSSSSSSPPPSSISSLSSPPPAARFSVSGTVAGGSRLEAGLEGVCALLNKTHSCQIRRLHVETADPVLADIVANMHHHMRTEFATFAWPRALTDRAQEILRRISVLTLVVEVTIEYVPEKESLFRRFSHQIKSVFSFFRRLR